MTARWAPWFKTNSEFLSVQTVEDFTIIQKSDLEGFWSYNQTKCWGFKESTQGRDRKTVVTLSRIVECDFSKSRFNSSECICNHCNRLPYLELSNLDRYEITHGFPYTCKIWGNDLKKRREVMFGTTPCFFRTYWILHWGEFLKY